MLFDLYHGCYSRFVDQPVSPFLYPFCPLFIYFCSFYPFLSVFILFYPFLSVYSVLICFYSLSSVFYLILYAFICSIRFQQFFFVSIRYYPFFVIVFVILCFYPLLSIFLHFLHFSPFFSLSSFYFTVPLFHLFCFSGPHYSHLCTYTHILIRASFTSGDIHTCE